MRRIAHIAVEARKAAVRVLRSRPTTNTTTIRTIWSGVPVPLQTLWALSKGSRIVTLVLYTHQLGWECRVDGAGILLTQVCRSDQEIEDVSAAWCDAMIEKGWRSA